MLTRFAALNLCSVLLLLIAVQTTLGADKPNIVVILADDLGWKDVGFHGSEIRTPRLDALVNSGVELRQFYVQPVCSPTRGALLSGKYPMRLGLQCGVVRPWATHGLPLEERTLPQLLKEAGYKTAICGKWHLGHSKPEYLPLARGFDLQYGHYNGALDYWTHIRDGGLDWHRQQQGLEETGYTTDLIGNAAVGVIEEHTFDQPLFLYVPFNAPHSPLQAPDEYLAQYAEIADPKRKVVAAMVACMDHAVGLIVDSLERRGQLGNTLIFFCSDNGGLENYGANNGMLRGGKGRLYEGGVRVPAIMYWPGVLKPGQRVDAMMHITDILPTALSVADMKLPQDLVIDGLDQWPTIRDQAAPVRSEILLNASPFQAALRIGPWKLIQNGATTANARQVVGKPTWELFNLESDPYEATDLAATEREQFTSLQQRLAELQSQAVEPIIPPNQAPQDFQFPAVW